MRPAAIIGKRVLRALGLNVSRYHEPRAVANVRGEDLYLDIVSLMRGRARPLVIDVGANIGQSVIAFKEALPGCEIHSFEPSPESFRTLKENVRGYGGVTLNNLAVGAESSTGLLRENSYPTFSSLLTPTEICWGEIVRKTPVEVVTLDDYCRARGLGHVDLLKTDTQGYDLEVLKGAEGLLREGRVRMVLTEMIFSELYEGAPRFDHVCGHLLDRGFRLVSFYRFYYREGLAAWTDALFLYVGLEKDRPRL